MSAHQIDEVWKQFLSVFSASCSSIVPPLGFKKLYLRENHFSGGNTYHDFKNDIIENRLTFLNGSSGFCVGRF